MRVRPLLVSTPVRVLMPTHSSWRPSQIPNACIACRPACYSDRMVCTWPSKLVSHGASSASSGPQSTSEAMATAYAQLVCPLPHPAVAAARHCSGVLMAHNNISLGPKGRAPLPRTCARRPRPASATPAGHPAPHTYVELHRPLDQAHTMSCSG